MKALLKKATERLGGHVFSRDSLPTGVSWLQDILRSLALGAAPVCFDIGANEGQTVAELRQAFPDASIHAFEPFAQPLAGLRRATSADAKVTVVAQAMGSAPGRIDIQPNPLSLMSSLAQVAEHQGDGTTESIAIDTVDGYCARLGIERIDVLKSDTEGYDLEVLRGAVGMLQGQRVAYVYVEVTFLPGNRQNSPFGPVFELLQGHGYRFLGLYETYPLHFYAEPLVFCNALFVASSVREKSLALRGSVGAQR